MKVHILGAARADVDDACAYYEGQRQGLGVAFADEVGKAMRRIVQMPEAWHPIGRSIRRCQMHQFPYGIIYKFDKVADEIIIIGVGHFRRKPGWWHGR